MRGLPEETINIEIQDMCRQLFEEIEDRKSYFERMDQALKRKKRAEAEQAQVSKEIQKEDMKAWEDTRDERVASWRTFSMKKQRTEKKKKMRYGVHAPPLRAEQRPAYAKKPKEEMEENFN